MLNINKLIEATLRTPQKEELVGKRVYVYYNLHTHTWSVRLGTKVVLHTDYIKLKDVEFRVRSTGREKVRAEQSKNVHAFVIGDIVDYSLPGEEIPTPTLPIEVTYNPYKYNNFIVKSTEEELFNADEVEMIKRKVYASSSLNENKQNKNMKNNTTIISRMIWEAKKKGKKVNPWAVCTSSIAKTAGTTERSEWSKKEMDRYERCVLDVKKEMKEAETNMINEVGGYDDPMIFAQHSGGYIASLKNEFNTIIQSLNNIGEVGGEILDDKLRNQLETFLREVQEPVTQLGKNIILADKRNIKMLGKHSNN